MHLAATAGRGFAGVGVRQEHGPGGGGVSLGVWGRGTGGRGRPGSVLGRGSAGGDTRRGMASPGVRRAARDPVANRPAEHGAFYCAPHDAPAYSSTLSHPFPAAWRCGSRSRSVGGLNSRTCMPAWALVGAPFLAPASRVHSPSSFIFSCRSHFPMVQQPRYLPILPYQHIY